MLYTLSCTPWRCDLNAILRVMKNGDDLLLIQDGVLGVIEGSYFIKVLMNSPATISALKEDIDARGISSYVSIKVTVISYACFVDLVVKHTCQISWY